MTPPLRFTYLAGSEKRAPRCLNVPTTYTCACKQEKCYQRRDGGCPLAILTSYELEIVNSRKNDEPGFTDASNPRYTWSSVATRNSREREFVLDAVTVGPLAIARVHFFDAIFTSENGDQRQTRADPKSTRTSLARSCAATMALSQRRKCLPPTVCF